VTDIRGLGGDMGVKGNKLFWVTRFLIEKDSM